LTFVIWFDTERAGLLTLRLVLVEKRRAFLDWKLEGSPLAVV
jgi:hypothetical protein